MGLDALRAGPQLRHHGQGVSFDEQRIDARRSMDPQRTALDGPCRRQHPAGSAQRLGTIRFGRGERRDHAGRYPVLDPCQRRARTHCRGAFRQKRMPGALDRRSAPVVAQRLRRTQPLHLRPDRRDRRQTLRHAADNLRSEKIRLRHQGRRVPPLDQRPPHLRQKVRTGGFRSTCSAAAARNTSPR